MKCPKCQSDNPETKQFCGDCGTQLIPSPVAQPAFTKTLQTPTEELTRGTLFADRYEIIEELGSGGMGKVYRVEDTKLKQEIALKLIKPEIALDKNTVDRFQNELKSARMITHKNVCRMYDMGEFGERHFITMEYVRGEDLRSMIRMTGQLGISTVVSVAKQICEGLSEAHRLGVVHRDLKPNNVRIDDEGNVRIMDFGIARSASSKDLTGRGVMIGTPEYMSPEQIEGKDVDHRADIYSLGVILYEMATGGVPFEGDTPFTVGVKHKSEIPEEPLKRNPQIPGDLNRLIMKCLEKDKEKRYQSTAELCSDLEKIQQGLPTTAREIKKKKPLTSKEITVTFGLKKLLFPGLAIAAVAVAALLVWQLVLKKPRALAPEERRSIAVISFDNQTGQESYNYLRKVIPNLLITNLEQSGYFNVTTWERLQDLLKQKGLGDVEFIDRDLGFELCRMEGIDAVVLGTFAKAGEVFATDVKVLDVTSKEILKSANATGDGEGSILKMQIDELSAEIAKGIGRPKGGSPEIPVRVADVTTSSMEAYDLYLKGRTEYDKFLYIDAVISLEKAVELDPTFAVAYMYLARANAGIGNIEARNWAIEQAMENLERASEKERLYIEAYHAGIVERDDEKRIRLLNEIRTRYPKEKSAYYLLGVIYSGKLMIDEAIDILVRALDLDPNYGVALNQLAYVYADSGDFEKSLATFEKYVSVSPGDPNPLDSMAEVYFKMGRLDESIEKYKEALEISPVFDSIRRIGYVYALKEDYPEAMRWMDRFISTFAEPGKKAEGHLWKGFLYDMLGRQSRAFEEFRKADELALSVGNLFRSATLDWLRGWSYYEREELGAAQEHFRSALDGFQRIMRRLKWWGDAWRNFFSGLVELKKGNTVSAKSYLGEIHPDIPEFAPDQKMWVLHLHDVLHSEILLAEGALDEAIAACLATIPLIIPSMSTDQIGPYNAPVPRDTLARAYLEKGDLDKAIEAYEKIVTFDPSGSDRRLIHPRYHYKLAILYEKKGANTEAIREYEKFLEFWKDADPGLPEVEDAKRRLAGLKGN